MAISPSLGGAFLHRSGRMTKNKRVPKKMAVIFRPTWFFCRNILKFGNLPTAFINLDEILTVTHWSNDLSLWIDGRTKV